MTDLFSPLTIRGVTLKNRIGISPMCQYCCAEDGMPTEWHLQHLASRAIGGAAVVIAEATAVAAVGRITPGDLGLWSDAHTPGHARLATMIAACGAVPGIQIAHAGRKASRGAPWENGPAKHGWPTLGASAVAFDDFATPRAMTEADIEDTIGAFAATAHRAAVAGYRFVEIHGAHGYLLHSFVSPLSNKRNDRWGGDFEGRTLLVREVCRAVRAALPDDAVLCLRVSHTDWAEGGWTTEETVELARRVKALGVDMVDCSSGGVSPAQKVPLGPGYQVPGSVAVREGAGVLTAAVGLITEPAQANAIIAEGKADLVLLARAVLRDPYWPIHAAAALGMTERLRIPPQYDRGWSSLGKMTMDHALAAPAPKL